MGAAGITQYDHISGMFFTHCASSRLKKEANFTDCEVKDKGEYFDSVEAVRALQDRWKAEAGIDVLQRVMTALREASGMPVRLASEGDRDYLAGILRAVDRGIGVHADFAPYVRTTVPC